MRPLSHVSDDRLIEIFVERSPADHEMSHLSVCDSCRARRARLEAMLRDIETAADAEVDEIFTPERLASQQARILQRIDQDGRPARVIAFPAAPSQEARPLRTRPAGRWIAGAAAAGLALGLLAGQLMRDLPTFDGPSGPALVSTPGRSAADTPAPLQTAGIVNASFNDEEFLTEIESALDGPHVAVLQPLNDLTPR